mmetsp:Transcript_126788/g.370630  ORF Transcript_126788/g.370630 Transcript_126788/m.370630 type:complete len:233 (+) Transcript_126788:46-744(+)
MVKALLATLYSLMASMASAFTCYDIVQLPGFQLAVLMCEQQGRLLGFANPLCLDILCFSGVMMVNVPVCYKFGGCGRACGLAGCPDYAPYCPDAEELEPAPVAKAGLPGEANESHTAGQLLLAGVVRDRSRLQPILASGFVGHGDEVGLFPERHNLSHTIRNIVQVDAAVQDLPREWKLVSKVQETSAEHSDPPRRHGVLLYLAALVVGAWAASLAVSTWRRRIWEDGPLLG